jgi:hypothetical protein
MFGIIAILIVFIVGINNIFNYESSRKKSDINDTNPYCRVKTNKWYADHPEVK